MQRNLPIVILFTLIASVFGSCGKDPVDQFFDGDRRYYDVESFVRTQTQNLKNRRQKVQKRVTKDGYDQVVILENVNWDEELEPFREADLNKPAWRDAYTSDTLILSAVNLITYRAKNPSLPYTTMTITFDRESGRCTRLSVEKHVDNFLYSSSRKLYYITGEGYTVKGRLKVNYLYESEYSVESTFIH